MKIEIFSMLTWDRCSTKIVNLSIHKILPVILFFLCGFLLYQIDTFCSTKSIRYSSTKRKIEAFWQWLIKTTRHSVNHALLVLSLTLHEFWSQFKCAWFKLAHSVTLRIGTDYYKILVIFGKRLRSMRWIKQPIISFKRFLNHSYYFLVLYVLQQQY
jgi:hypothetical protein